MSGDQDAVSEDFDAMVESTWKVRELKKKIPASLFSVGHGFQEMKSGGL